MAVRSVNWLRMGVVVCGVSAALLLAAGPAALAQSSFPPPPPQSPPVVHYHYHYHYHAPWEQGYPGYHRPALGGGGNPLALPGAWGGPTPTHPYPPGYILGPFAPQAFMNAEAGRRMDEGIIDVLLPVAKATVYLNGQKMRGKGKYRKFTTPPLPRNQPFQYYVTATFVKDGEKVTDYRKIDLGAGDYAVADFTRPPLDNPVKLKPGPVSPNEAYPPQPYRVRPRHGQ